MPEEGAGGASARAPLLAGWADFVPIGFIPAGFFPASGEAGRLRRIQAVSRVKIEGRPNDGGAVRDRVVRLLPPLPAPKPLVGALREPVLPAGLLALPLRGETGVFPPGLLTFTTFLYRLGISLIQVG
jgi:hypothetical protein